MKQTSQRPILCATDFSESATKAADVAAVMPMRLDAPPLLAHGIIEAEKYLLRRRRQAVF